MGQSLYSAFNLVSLHPMEMLNRFITTLIDGYGVAGLVLIVLYLSGYLLFQIIAGIVIFNKLMKKY